MACQSCVVTSKALIVRNGTPKLTPFTPMLPSKLSSAPRRFRTRFSIQAEPEFDVEVFVNKLTTKFENAENKPVVIGYGVAALFALFFTEYIIHLPGLDVLLGFPIQLVGVLILPLLLIRYLVDKEDPYKDIEGTLEKLGELLPGFKK